MPFCFEHLRTKLCVPCKYRRHGVKTAALTSVIHALDWEINSCVFIKASTVFCDPSKSSFEYLDAHWCSFGDCFILTADVPLFQNQQILSHIFTRYILLFWVKLDYVRKKRVVLEVWNIWTLETTWSTINNVWCKFSSIYNLCSKYFLETRNTLLQPTTILTISSAFLFLFMHFNLELKTFLIKKIIYGFSEVIRHDASEIIERFSNFLF